MRPFSKKTDVETMNQWLTGHGHEPMEVSLLPLAGLIEPDVACGFLYQTDSCVAFLEHFVSNPKAKARDVFEAVNEMIEALILLAAQMGIEKLFVMSKRPSTVRRAQAHGFSKHPDQWAMLSKEVH